jgi:hypothetical protein
MRSACQREIVSLESYKLKRAAKKGFQEWQSLFEPMPCLDENTKWSDLPDRLILFLCEDSTESRHAIYELMMSAHGLGCGYEFESLPSHQLLPLLDVHLFITDQLRFECMRRLGWIENILQKGKPIIEQVLDAAKPQPAVILETPRPNRKHPAYREYLKATSFDRGALIRRHIPDAIRQFKKRLAEKNGRSHDRSSKS